MPMTQQEIDDISSTFEEAWREYFGMEVYYLRLRNTMTSDSELYDEKIGKENDFEIIGPLVATFKKNPTEKEIADAGLSERVSGIFTFVVKSLVDKGITQIRTVDRIRLTDRFGNTTTYLIRDYNERVQFVDNYIFVKVGVNEIES